MCPIQQWRIQKSLVGDVVEPRAEGVGFGEGISLPHAPMRRPNHCQYHRTRHLATRLACRKCTELIVSLQTNLGSPSAKSATTWRSAPYFLRAAQCYDKRAVGHRLDEAVGFISGLSVARFRCSGLPRIKCTVVLL